MGNSSNEEGDSNENVKKRNIRFIEQYNKLAFEYISLPSLLDYDVTIPIF